MEHTPIEFNWDQINSFDEFKAAARLLIEDDPSIKLPVKKAEKLLKTPYFKKGKLDEQ